MKPIVTLQRIALLALMSTPTTVFAQFHPGDGRPPCPPPGPPPVAIDACNQQAEGTGCAFVGRFGEQITGTCVVFPRLLACLPEGAPPPPPAPGDDAER